MKIKHLLLAAAAAVLTFAACQEKVEDLGEPNIDLSTATLEFGQGANSQTITLNSTRDWKATDVADWVVVEPASGKASKEDQTVTIAVLENTDVNRTCTIKFTCGIDSEYLTVNQAGPQGGPVEGEGSKASPYSASQANRLGAELGAEEQLADVFVAGKISTIKSVDTSFGNAEYYISDDGKAENEFYIYRGYSLGGNKFTSQDEIKVGDEVVVYGTIINYLGKQGYIVEMTTGSKIIILNGEEFEGGQGGGDVVEPISGTNLLTNGSFEDWTDTKPTAWDFTSGNATLVKSSDAKEGSNACEVQGSDQNKRLMSKEYVLLPGTYQIQAYIKGEGQYRAGYTVLENGAPKDSDSYIYVDVNPVQATSDWALHTVQFKLEAQTSVSVTIMNSKKGNGKTIIVDDVKLVTNDGGLGEGGDDGGASSGTPSGDGSKASPYNATAAHQAAAALAADTPTSEYYYIKGFVKKIASIDTGTYGNANFYITDTKEGNTEDFYCFQVMYLNGAKFTSSDQLKVGDEVVVYAQLINYKGNTPETVGKGSGKIISINGQGGDDGGQTGEVVEATVSQVMSEQNENVTYRLTGTVSGFNSQYCSFDITDATGKIYVYSVDAATKAEYSTKLANGDTVTIEGKYTYYAQKSQHEIVNAKITAWTKGSDDGGGQGGDVVDATVSQVISEQNENVIYRLTGTVSGFNSQYCSFDITDATGKIYVYSVDAATKAEYSTKLANGDTVTIEGKYTYYAQKSQHEIVNAKITAWTKGSDDGGQGGDDVVDPSTLTQLTCKEFNALSTDDEEYYILEGKVVSMTNTQDGNLYIQDDSGEQAYIYGLNGSNGEAFTDLGIEKNDIIKIYGQHTIYNGTTVEMKDAKLLNLTKGEKDEVESVVTLTFPDDNSANNKVGSYTADWTAKTGDHSFAIFGFNNNNWNNNWTFIKCGRKSDDSTASIATAQAISDPVSNLIVSFDAMDASKVTSLKLLVASDAEFSNVIETIDVTPANGDVKVEIGNPAANLYYKLAFECTKHGKSNGFVQISKLVFAK